MDSLPECKTPKIDKTELFSPPLINTPLRVSASSSKGLLTPCRQVGLRRRSLKSVISPLTAKNQSMPITSSVISPVSTANESTPVLPVLKKHCSPESGNQNCHTVESNGEDNNNDKHNKPNENKISTTDEEKCTLIEELNMSSIKTNTDNTPKHPSLKNSYKPSPRCKRVLRSFQNSQVVGKQNTVDNNKPAHSNPTKDVHYSSISTDRFPVANDFSHIVKTIPFYGEVKENEDLSDKIFVMRQYVKEKEEQLRLLKLAQLYRKKHNPEQLSASIEKWKEISKAAMYRVQEILTSRGQSLTMADLLNQFGIPHDILKFNSETDDFE